MAAHIGFESYPSLQIEKMQLQTNLLVTLRETNLLVTLREKDVLKHISYSPQQ
jgi:hypothetical protein